MSKITPEMLARSGSEDGEQAALFCHAHEEVKRGNTVWAKLFAIPNGGQREASSAARMVATGVKKGVPDVCLPRACFGAHGLYVELKRLDGKSSDVKDDQRRWHKDLIDEGYCVAIAYGWVEAVRIIEDYLAGKAIQYDSRWRSTSKV